MKLSRERLVYDSAASGFRPEILEKVIHLLSLLEAMQGHPYLKNRLALKGGTALNLFLFDLPRLSVDIDLNYIGARDRATMLAERPLVEQAISAVCSREGFSTARVPDDHAGGKWRLRYESVLGQGGTLEVDLNYMLCIPLWPCVAMESHAIGSFKEVNFPVLDEHELAAGKIAALLARHAARDLFDVHQLLSQVRLNEDKLRLAFTVYGAMNRKDWRTVSLDDVGFDAGELRDMLIPVLRAEYIGRIGDAARWASDMVNFCQSALAIVLPLKDHEFEFLERIQEQGEIVPELITADPLMIGRIKNHPGLLWKAQNVRQYKENR